MQDNYPQEFDEQFISEAWLKMRQLLDKEMPVQPKRRAAWWLWLLAGFLFVAVAGGAFFLLNKGADSPPPFHDRPVAGLEQQSAGGSPGTPKEPGSMNKVQDQKAEAQFPGKNAGALSTATLREPGAEAPKALSSEGNNPQATAFSESKERKDTPKGFDAGDTIENKGIVTGPVEKENQPVTSGKSLIPALPLERSSISKILPYSETSGESPLASIQAKKPRIFRAAIEGEGYYLAHSAPGGMGAGLALEFHPVNSRLYLRSGVFYRSYQPEATTAERSFQHQLANDINQLSSSTEAAVARYIQLPLTGGFQWTPRFALEAGVQAGQLLYSRTISKWSLENQGSSSGSPQQIKNTIYKFGQNKGNGLLRATSFDIIAGLAYRPGTRTSLRLHYQYGLANMLNSEQDEAYIRGLKLSLSYYIIP